MNLNKFASSLFLFKGLSDSLLAEIFSSFDFELRAFSRSEIIYSPSRHESKIGFVVIGRCEVRIAKPDGSTVILNTLVEGDAFGVLAVFADCDEYPTEIYASKNSEILFVSKSAVLDMIGKYPDVAMNVITFLSGRIKYLNKEIATFSGTRVEHRLASFLLRRYNENGDVFDFNCKKTSEAINAGRASVYRAIDVLVSEGIINFCEKKIKVINPEGLKEISK